MRAIYIWTACLCATLIAIGFCHAGILLMTLWRQADNRYVELFGTYTVASIIPLFFLAFMISVCLVTFKWAIWRLFKREPNLPDFF